MPDDGLNINDLLSAYLGATPGAGPGAVASAIRRRQGIGMLGMASGDPAMANTGKELAETAQHGMQTGIQSKHLDVQLQQMQDLMRHRQVLEGQGDTRLGIAAGHLDAINKRLALQGVKYNPNNGAFENITPLARPPRPSLLPKANGATTPTTPLPLPAADGASLPAAATPAAPAQTTIGKWQDAALKALGADFNPSSGRSGEFGKNQARVNAAKRILALAVDEKGAPRNLTPNQMPELAQSVAGLIGGGGGAQAQIEHLMPSSFSKDAAGILQYLTNEPKGAGQQAFVQNMVETAKREAQVAQQGVDQVRGQLAAKHQRILRSNPEEARKVLQGFGWDLGPDGMPIMQQAAAPSPHAAAEAPARNFTRVNGKLVEVK